MGTYLRGYLGGFYRHKIRGGVVNKNQAEREAKLVRIKRVKYLLEDNNIPYISHRDGVHIQVNSNFGDVHIWASTDKMQVRGINYIYNNHRELIDRLLELRVKPNWMK